MGLFTKKGTTTVVIEWETTRNGHSLKYSTSGAKMPPEIVIATINHFLSAAGPVEIDVREPRG